MIVEIIEYANNVSVEVTGVTVLSVVEHNIPSGITADVLTEAGGLIVATGPSIPAQLAAPVASELVLTSDLNEPQLMKWAAAAAGGGSIELTNKSGSNQTAGTVVVLDKTNDSAFTTTTTLNDRRVVGVLAESIDSNAAGKVAVKGKVVTVKVQGNVSRGYWLILSATVGRAAQYGIVPPSTGGIGIALTSYSGGGAGTVEALVDINLYSAFQQIELLGTAAHNSNTASSLSATHTLSAGSNRIAFVITTCQVGQTVSGVTYGGVSMTRLGTGVAGSSERMEIYYLLEASMPADGSKTVTVTYSGSTDCLMTVFTIKNAKQSAPSTPVTNSSAGATYLSGNVSVTVEGSFAIAGVFNRGVNTFTHDTGQVEIDDFNASIGTLAASYEEHETTGTKTQGSTASNSNRMLFMATVVEPV